MTYYRNAKEACDDSSQAETLRKNILLIAKAAMSKKYEDFKFVGLDKEIDFNITPEQVDVWKKNVVKNDGNITVKETYEFGDTMTIGVYPNETCMNYKHGMYRQCLLATFDSNKKLLYAYIDGVKVARAIVRITKTLTDDETVNSSLVFNDVELGEDVNATTSNEKITIFLEHLYIANAPGATHKKIVSMFVNACMEKARELNARFLLSDDYSGYDDNFEYARYKVFISRSKNGYQYLDSFGGYNKSERGGTYNSYRVCKPIEK